MAAGAEGEDDIENGERKRIKQREDNLTNGQTGSHATSRDEIVARRLGEARREVAEGAVGDDLDDVEQVVDNTLDVVAR